jgi:hypothetical protein
VRSRSSECQRCEPSPSGLGHAGLAASQSGGASRNIEPTIHSRAWWTSTHTMVRSWRVCHPQARPARNDTTRMATAPPSISGGVTSSAPACQIVNSRVWPNSAGQRRPPSQTSSTGRRAARKNSSWLTPPSPWRAARPGSHPTHSPVASTKGHSTTSQPRASAPGQESRPKRRKRSARDHPWWPSQRNATTPSSRPTTVEMASSRWPRTSMVCTAVYAAHSTSTTSSVARLTGSGRPSAAAGGGAERSGSIGEDAAGDDGGDRRCGRARSGVTMVEVSLHVSVPGGDARGQRPASPGRRGEGPRDPAASRS